MDSARGDNGARYGPRHELTNKLADSSHRIPFRVLPSLVKLFQMILGAFCTLKPTCTEPSPDAAA
jgi:hypothetical protein